MKKKQWRQIDCGWTKCHASCGSSSALVTIRFRLGNLSLDVTKVQVDATLDGAPDIDRAELSTDLERVTVKIPKSKVGDGALSVSVVSIDDNRCKVGGAQHNVDLTAEPLPSGIAVDLSLELLPPKLSTLSVDLTQDALIRSMPTGIDCETSCEADFPFCTTVPHSWPLVGGASQTDWGVPCGDDDSPDQGNYSICKLTMNQSFSVRPKTGWAIPC